jgi:hypothetical protein
VLAAVCHLFGVSAMLTPTTAADGRTVGPDPQPAVNAELLDVRAVAALLGGCSVRHVYRLSDAGKCNGSVDRAPIMRYI